MKGKSQLRPPDDGPTIDGRPILSVAEVQQWYRNAYDVTPAHDDASTIAVSLNHCALFASQWKSTRDLKKLRRTNPSTLRLRRINEALTSSPAKVRAGNPSDGITLRAIWARLFFAR